MLLTVLQACLSYVSFFALVWWIWASRVAYDVRFTKGDWIHRIFLFLQFIIFCALAAFTKDFDIGYDLMKDQEEEIVLTMQKYQNYSKAEIGAAQYRLDRLPILNAKGVSLVLMLSRILLLLQYTLGEWSLPRDIHQTKGLS